MATIHSLAPEILIGIFELAHDPRKPSTMCAASLVCRAWRDPAQRTLFLDISIPGAGYSSVRYDTWEAYKSMRLYAPRRAELYLAPLQCNVLGIAAGSYQLELVRDLRELTLDGVTLNPDFLSDSNLQGLERVTFNHSTFKSPDLYPPGEHAPPKPTWPANLRALRIDSLQLDTLLNGYRLLAPLVSLTLDVQWINDRVDVFPSTHLIPTTTSDLSINLPVPRGGNTFNPLPFFASVKSLRHLTLVLGKAQFIPHSRTVAFVKVLVGSLPSSIKRLELKNVGGAQKSLLQTPFNEILELFANDKLPNLTRLEFPDCKRKDLEDEAAAADLLAECERKLIRVVCWEEFL